VKLRAHGIAVHVPRGWDGRIFRRSESPVPAAPGVGIADVPTGGWTAPVLHLGSFGLPDDRGDYGSGAVNRMRRDDVFVALVEFGPESVGTAMFARAGLPRLRARELTTATMQRPIPDMGGAQHFCTVAGRPFCVYAVIGSLARRSALVGVLNDALAGVTISPRGHR
jgi:hypothetical protein